MKSSVTPSAISLRSRDHRARASSHAQTGARRPPADAPAIRARLVNLYKLGSGRYTRLLLSTSDVQTSCRRVEASHGDGQDQDRDRAAAHQRAYRRSASPRAPRSSSSGHAWPRSAPRPRVRAPPPRQRCRPATRLIKEIDERRDLNASSPASCSAPQQRLQSTLSDLASKDSAVAAEIAPWRNDGRSGDPADRSLSRRPRVAGRRLAPAAVWRLAAGTRCPVQRYRHRRR